MTTHNKTLQLIASKLGLADEDKVLRKAAEFERLLQTKTTAGINMTDTSKVVICLDLASFALGVPMDTKTAMKYSGMKPSVYNNSRKVVENLLELNSDKPTVAGVCVRLQCNGVRELAESILEEYQKQAKMEIDLNLPQYVCMAVHQACRLKKVKVLKSKVIETSRLRPAQWNKLEADWTKFVDKHFAATKKKRDRSVKNTAVDEAMEIDKSQKEELPLDPQTELYEDWKNRILEAAYKELRELEESQQQQVKKQKVEKIEVDRRSPRKHSQNMTPRRNSKILSPIKGRDPRRNSQLFSPSKDQQPKIQVTQNLSSRKLSQGLSPRKENMLSPIVLLSPLQDQTPTTRVSQNLSSRKLSQGLSPRKENILSPTVLLSPLQHQTPTTRVSQNLSSRKLSQGLSPRKENILSPTVLLSPLQHQTPTTRVSQNLSSRKLSQGLSTRKENQLSPRKDSPMQEDMSPRRSPRKTPQKYFPYRPPTTKTGVRLLFPNN